MFGQIHWSRWALLFLMILTIGVTETTNVGRSQVGGVQTDFNLTGIWKLDKQHLVTISQDRSGNVTANFTPPVRCLSSTWNQLFTAKLSINRSSGSPKYDLASNQFSACTRTRAMVTECGVKEVFTTEFKAIVSPYGLISGQVRRPHYDYDIVGGRRVNCQPRPEKDGWSDFELELLCRPSTPWFDKGTNCQDAQSPVITFSQDSGVLSICGSTVFRFGVPGYDSSVLQAYGTVLQTELTRQIGSKVCCQAFRDAVRTGQPCNPSVDVDCDGKRNQADILIDTPGIAGSPEIRFPDISIFSSPPGAAVAPFPAGLNPDDPGFVPNSTGCPCKWQLIKGVLNCGSAGQGHSYVATWKCPTTGREVTTTKNATPNTPCP